MTTFQSAAAFFGLRYDDGKDQWSLPVERPVTSGTGALFGGVALGAAVAVVEAVTERPLVWATVQFVAHVMPPAEVVFEVVPLATGRRASQLALVARVDGRQMFAATATCGDRDADAVEATFPVWPDVPPPAECPPRPVLEQHRGRFMSRTDARLALAWPEAGQAADGRSAVWVRVPELEPGAALLGVLADYVPFGVRQAIGEGFATHSLDNTLRVARLPDPGWVLADVAVHAVAGGFGYGAVHLWDEQRRLLGTGSQSFTSRRR